MNDHHNTPTDHLSEPAILDQRPIPRVRVPDRSGLIRLSIDQLIEPEHPVRQLWRFLTEELDFSVLDAQLKTLPGQPGRTPFDRRTLAAVWLYATTQGVTSGRELQRLCSNHRAYIWICGGVSINYHTLDDFRSRHADWLMAQFARVVQIMTEEGLIDPTQEILGQDGMRVRANAGSASFRSAKRLAELASPQAQDQAQAENQAQTEHLSAGQLGARRRAQRERAERIERAQEVVAEVGQAKEARKKGDGVKARASTTDPEARKMKMGDGGTRPAYNLQFATTLRSLVIIGLFISPCGSDAREVRPMLEQIQKQHSQVSDVMVADGGFSTRENITAAAQYGAEYYCPVKHERELKAKGLDPYQSKKGDNPEMAQWRQRMSSEEAAEIYKERSKCELPNAYCRNRGLGQFSVRGQQKVQVQACWYGLAYNYQRLVTLRAALRTNSDTAAA